PLAEIMRQSCDFGLFAVWHWRLPSIMTNFVKMSIVFFFLPISQFSATIEHYKNRFLNFHAL
ncbi:MAG: hypothetical protein IJL24_04690, partial [Treponema sp.]|nr:hypothetical protein [Treponema sp.]